MFKLKCFKAVILTTAIALSTSAFAQSKDAPGVTSTEIKIGQTVPFSGPASAYASGAKVNAAYINMINEQGGVNGRKINLIQLDDGYSPPKTFEQTRKLVEKDGVAFIAMQVGSPTAISVRKYLNDKKIPQLFVGTILPEFDDPTGHPWSMGWQPSARYEAKAIGDYILKKYPNAKIGILAQNDDAGKESTKILKETLGARAKEMIVKELTYETTDPSIDSQVITLQASGANIFMNWTSPKQAAQGIRKAYDIGWKPELQVLTGNAASISQVLEPAGTDKAVGVVTVAFLKTPGPQWASDKGYQDWLAFMKKYAPNSPLDQLSVYGYSQAQTLVQVLQQAGNDLSRENIMKQAAHLDMELPMLMPGVRVKTSPTDFAPIDTFRIQRFDGKDWQMESDK